MQPLAIYALAGLMVMAGAAMVYYQSLGRRKFESIVTAVGVALVVCGLTMLRDEWSGSRNILWMASGAHSEIVATALAG
jgi:hypothetical protein